MRISQFKPALYFLLLLGITGFAIASQSPGIWLLGTAGVALNGWLVATGRFRPLPRVLANVITLASMFFIARQLFSPINSPVLTIGQFLVILQVVKLWEQRANRDYGQLLVLSLLLMVAACINASSLIFGLILIGYLFLSLYCCLLFHLKVETDKAMAAYPLPQEKISPAVLRQDQRFLSRSMRRLAMVTSTGSILMAIVVFLVFPRSSGQSFLVPSQTRLGATSVGYGEDFNFNNISRIQQNDRIIAYTSVTRNGRMLGAGDSIYLRGSTKDRYRGEAVDPSGAISRRYAGRGSFDRDARDYQAIGVAKHTAYTPRDTTFVPRPAGEPTVTFTQKTSLSPTGTRTLFVVSGTGVPGERVASIRSFTGYRDLSIVPGTDLGLQTEDILSGAVEYEATSDDLVNQRDLNAPRFPMRFGLEFNLLEPIEVTDPGSGLTVPALRVNARVQGPTFLRCFGFRDSDSIIAVDGRRLTDIPEQQRMSFTIDAYLAGKPLTVVTRGGRVVTLPYVNPEIEKFARNPEVSGVDDAGRPLAEQRNRLAGPGPLDEAIATNIARYLRTQFSYTLDITDSESRPDTDPILWFLSADGRRGHCQYFAGAMTLLCQTLGINARLVSGFKCDEFNPYSNQFVVRQAHAHAWVEVLTPSGWVTFDPTSARDIDTRVQEYGLMQQFKHLLNWLEFSYANNIIAYDNDSREGLMQALESEMTRPLYRGVNEGWITRKFGDSAIYKALTDPDSAVASWVAMVVGLVVSCFAVRAMVYRWRLRRRAARIGLDALPPAEQLRLARQLGFYDDLLQILERRHIERPAHLTPLEFARSLLYLPAGAYTSVRRLTEVFYRVRYGQQELSAGLQQRLRRAIEQLDRELEPGT